MIRFRILQEVLLIGSAVKVGIFDTLKEKPRSIDEISVVLRCDARSVWMVCEALEELGYMTKKDEKFALTSKALRLIPNYSIKSWMSLPEVIKIGKPVYPYLFKEKQYLKYFVYSQRRGGKREAPKIVKIILNKLPEAKTVLDIGGGTGSYAEIFTQYGLKVTVLDLPEVIELMRNKLEKIKGIRIFSGDFNKGLPNGQYDIAWLGEICHAYGSEENIQLFKRTYDILNSGGTIVINDFIRGKDLHAAKFAVHMLVLTQTGGTWTETEYKNWLQQSGFVNIQIVDVGEPHGQLIFAQKI